MQQVSGYHAHCRPASPRGSRLVSVRALLSEKKHECSARGARGCIQREVGQQRSIRETDGTRQPTGSSTRRNDTYLYSLLKSLNPPKDIVELALQALQVGPHGAGEASQEGRKEDSG